MFSWPVRVDTPLVRPIPPYEVTDVMHEWTRIIHQDLQLFPAEYEEGNRAFRPTDLPKDTRFANGMSGLATSLNSHLRNLFSWMDQLRTYIVMVDTHGIGLDSQDGFALRHHLTSAMLEGVRVVEAVRLYCELFEGDMFVPDSPLFTTNWMIVPELHLLEETTVWKDAHSS